MSEEEFLTHVKALAKIQGTEMDRDIGELWRMGFTVSDAYRYMRCREEVNPELPEKIALNRMRQIGSKYPAYTLRRKGQR